MRGYWKTNYYVNWADLKQIEIKYEEPVITFFVYGKAAGVLYDN